MQVPLEDSEPRGTGKHRPRRAIQSPQGSGNEGSVGSLCKVWGCPRSIQEPSLVKARSVRVPGA
eukprot:967402-Pelagomonas_calceolata.AAC.1